MKRLKTSVNRGFTLAEMLLVVAILTILTAVAAPNVAKYAKGIKLRELDDSARAIYMAAQHDFKDKIAIGKELTPDDTINDVPDRYTGDSSEENIPKIDYAIYHGSPEANGLVTVGAIEPELAANSYIIEFNAETGDVYGVFYSINPDEFEDYAANYNDGKYAAAVNKTADRVDTLGYYGLENVAVKPAPKPGDIPTPKVNIINKEKLSLTVENPLGGGNAYVEVKVNGVDIVPRSGGYYMSPGGSAEIVLDSLDTSLTALPLELTGKVFEKRFADWAKDASGNYLIEPGKELNIKVTFYDPKGMAIDRVKTVTANSLFADGSSTETAQIEYGRHLQNLGECDTIQTAVIKRTIDFSNDDGNYEGWSNENVYKGRKFECLVQHSLSKLYGSGGAEIRYLEIDGNGLFKKLSSMDISNLKFFAPTVKNTSEDYAGVICGESKKTQYKNITIVNPIVEAMEGNYGNAGSLSGALTDEDSVDGCAVYVEGSEAEWNTTLDPYSKYVIKASSNAGGLVGYIGTVEIKNSYSAVKVQGATAGGIIGNIGAMYGEASIENSFASGHTYYGIFDGTAKDGTSVNLRDNISGKTVGGIFGTLMGYVKLSGKVFSTCSVCGTEEADTAYLDYNKKYGMVGGANVPDGSVVYTLGTAYKDNADGTYTEIKKSADTNIKTGNDVKDNDSTAVGRRYDMKVSSVFKYPLPSGMVMRGDWQSGEPVTGFFYWEKEGENYNIRSLYYDPQNPTTDGSPKEIASLGNADDIAVSESGYGIFSVDGDVDGAEYFNRSGDAFSTTPISDISTVMTPVGDDESGKIVNALKEALKKDDDKLKITDSNFKSAVYMTGNGVADSNGSVKAELNGKSFTFAPYFYDLDGGESGFGNSEKPFEVRTAQHLNNVRYFLTGKYFKQTHDLLPGAIEPIGSSAKPFKGSYDGAGQEIIDMKIKVSNPSEPAGMFGTTDGAKLENIAIRATAENTNFVETSAAPTATALSALAGSPISGINEILAAVDGEGKKAFSTEVTIGSYDSSFGYLLIDSPKSYDFFNAYSDNVGNGYIVRLNPYPKNSCELWFVSPDISPLGGFQITSSYDYNNTFIFSLDSTVVSKVLNAKNLKIYLYSSEYSTGQTVSISIGEDYDHIHQFDGSYKSDETGHWQQCTYPGCDFIQNFSGHEYSKNMYTNTTNPSGHQMKCTVCNHLADFEEHTMLWEPDPANNENGHKGLCTLCGFTDYSVHSHDFDGQECKDCGYRTEHHYALKYDDNNHWYECYRTDGCGGSLTGYQAHEFEYSANGNKHTARCKICGYSREEDHIRQIEEYDDTYHAYTCGKCMAFLETEAHVFEDEKCRICGYMVARPFGGIAGLAKNTTISGCKVLNYVLDGDQLTTEASKGAADYEFGGFYDLTHEGSIIGQSYYYIYPGQKCIICHGDKTGGCPYEYEMERLIMSAENAIKADHPEYAYRFRVVLSKGGRLEHSANNAAKFYCTNTEAHKGSAGPITADSPLKGNLITNGDDQYYEITAEALIDSYHNWNGLMPHMGQTIPDYWEFGIYTELTSGNDYERMNATINEFEYASLLNVTIGGIAGKIEIGTNSAVKSCETNISFGYAKTYGGIVGSASNCSEAAEISNNKALTNGSTKPLDKRAVRLAGILASKDGPLTLQNNKAAFRNLDTSWQYVFAVAPDADSTNKYVGGTGFTNGVHTGANEEKAAEITFEEFDKD